MFPQQWLATDESKTVTETVCKCGITTSLAALEKKAEEADKHAKEAEKKAEKADQHDQDVHDHEDEYTKQQIEDADNAKKDADKAKKDDDKAKKDADNELETAKSASKSSPCICPDGSTSYTGTYNAASDGTGKGGSTSAFREVRGQ